jgi:hypothetical protein
MTSELRPSGAAACAGAATRRAIQRQRRPQPRTGQGPDLDQIVFALQRAERQLQAHADRLCDAGDYSAEMPAEDAERMREAVVLTTTGGIGMQVRTGPGAEPSLVQDT